VWSDPQKGAWTPQKSSCGKFEVVLGACRRSWPSDGPLGSNSHERSSGYWSKYLLAPQNRTLQVFLTAPGIFSSERCHRIAFVCVAQAFACTEQSEVALRPFDRLCGTSPRRLCSLPRLVGAGLFPGVTSPFSHTTRLARAPFRRPPAITRLAAPPLLVILRPAAPGRRICVTESPRTGQLARSLLAQGFCLPR
jgi:hypothetical protein